MTQQEKGKNIFQQAVDAVSNRDEKAIIQEAMKKGEEFEKRAETAEAKVFLVNQKLDASEKKVTQLTADMTKTQSELAKAQADLAKMQAELNTVKSDLTTQKNRATIAEQRLAAANEVLQKHSLADQATASAAATAAAEKAKIMTEHTLKADESLSHLALKYYGSAYEPYWRVIYEANKELIGDNPGRVRPGMFIKIPILPEELKKK